MRCDLNLNSCQRTKIKALSGDDRDRTGDLLLAKQALSQLSYVPLKPDRLSTNSWAHSYGRKRDRTSDTRLIKTVLYQLSYAP